MRPGAFRIPSARRAIEKSATLPERAHLLLPMTGEKRGIAYRHVFTLPSACGGRKITTVVANFQTEQSYFSSVHWAQALHFRTERSLRNPEELIARERGTRKGEKNPRETTLRHTRYEGRERTERSAESPPALYAERRAVTPTLTPRRRSLPGASCL